MSETLTDILREETVELPARVARVCDKIQAQHKGRVLAFIYYGSSLRDLDNPEKMLDFYVIVDSYRKTHKSPLRAGLNALIPPAVYYLEHQGEDAVLSTCKYSIMSLPAFERRCSSKALLSQTWGRFSQPCALLRPASEDISSRITAARAAAVRHIARETEPLFGERVEMSEFWGRAFYESYRTEIRPESSTGRSAEIVKRYAERYARISAVLYDGANGILDMPPNRANGAKFRWFMRRTLGKPAAAIRVLNSAATFEGGADYIMRKVKNHSGVSLEITPFQRKHPVLCSPLLGWKLWRRGAFR